MAHMPKPVIDTVMAFLKGRRSPIPEPVPMSPTDIDAAEASPTTASATRRSRYPKQSPHHHRKHAFEIPTKSPRKRAGNH
jgi:hypothetical protein